MSETGSACSASFIYDIAAKNSGIEVTMSILRMSKTLLKNLFHGPYTVLYPVKKKETYQRTRGSIGITIEDCIFCGMCERRCPTGAIKTDKAKTEWSIQRMKCIQCGYCCEVCPKKCLTMENQYSTPAYEKVRDEFIKCTNTQSPRES